MKTHSITPMGNADSRFKMDSAIQGTSSCYEKVREKALVSGKNEISYYHLRKFDKKYDEVIHTAYEENPLPEEATKKRGRKKKSKVLNVISRLENYKASVCLFINNLCVPFGSNRAERDLRMIKVKTKVLGCFRSEEGT